MHKTTGQREPAASLPLVLTSDDRWEREQANRAIGVSAVGLALTGFIELAIALVSGSVALLGDALHNLSDVSTSPVVFIGFRVSRKGATERYPYGYERAEDLAGVGIAIVIWASAALAAGESIDKLIRHGSTLHPAWGIGAAAVGILGNKIVARYKLRVGRRINSATMVADARHSWLDALSSAGAAVGLIGVLAGFRWADAVAGLVVTGFICHVGWEVSVDVVHRLMDGVEPEIITTAETVAAAVAGVSKLPTELGLILDLQQPYGETALAAALDRAVKFGRWHAGDVRSILNAGLGTAQPRSRGEALVVRLPAVPSRALADYALSEVAR